MNDRSRPARRRRRWRTLLACTGLAIVGAAFGCTATIRPPANPLHPTTVFLLREAMHTGLVLPSLDGGAEFVEFGFGDWSWFALGRDQWYHAFATVLWPTPGTLGRRTFAAADEQQLRARVYWADLSAVVVDGAAAHKLHQQLQRQWQDQLAAAVTRPDLGWTFVPCDRSYWLPQNCADVAAEWFVALDCQVSWLPVRLGLSVQR